MKRYPPLSRRLHTAFPLLGLASAIMAVGLGCGDGFVINPLPETSEGACIFDPSQHDVQILVLNTAGDQDITVSLSSESAFVDDCDVVSLQTITVGTASFKDFEVVTFDVLGTGGGSAAFDCVATDSTAYQINTDGRSDRRCVMGWR